MLLSEGLLAEASIVRHHHERWDGTGYPDRLHGEAIPLESRIILVADTLDAMTTNRPYRVAMRREMALDEIRRASGSQFDPACVAALCGPPGIGAG
jgi:HD-GYP domain-containing protein (c-di-GMP phosphodiesterase class II)